MKEEFLTKLKDWYKNITLQRYETINETETDVLILTAVRDIDKVLYFEIVRIFYVGDSVKISIHKSINNNELNFDSVSEIIKTILRLY